MNDFTYISWGCGLQSTVLVEMLREGTLKADRVYFADTQDEPYWVYETLEFYRKRCPIPVDVVTRGSLSEDLRKKVEHGKLFACIPAWTVGEDGEAVPTRRQCTREYKIEVITQAVRKVLGYKSGQRVKHKVVNFQGISFDECDRMAPSKIPWVENSYPLIDMRLDRTACKQFFLDRGLPVPRKSSCRYCPYHSDWYWKRMKAEDGEEFEQACQVDELIRGMSTSNRGIDWPVFVHRSLVPLREAYFGESQLELFHEDCSGHCGV